jgi:hypothetical protein
MKRSTLFRLALLSMAVAPIQSANAGSAVAIGPHNHLVYSYGHPKEIAEQRALEMAHQLYGADVRLLAASDVTGYGAVAIAHHGIGWVTGVALGRPSASDAEHLAIEQCLRVGGTDPKIRWRWRG